DSTLGARGRAKRADDDRASRVDAFVLPGGERVEQFLHPIGLAVVGAVGEPPTTVGGVSVARSLKSGTAAWAAASAPCRVSADRTPPRISPSRSRRATVPAGKKSSVYGDGGRHPP